MPARLCRHSLPLCLCLRLSGLCYPRPAGRPGMGPGVVSVTTLLTCPRAAPRGLGQVAPTAGCPAQPGCSRLIPLSSPGTQLRSSHPSPSSPGERCPLPTLSHCLGISPETLPAFCCPYLYLFRLIYTLASSLLLLGASPSLRQLPSRPLLLLDLFWWPWGHCPAPVRRTITSRG